MKSLVPIVVPTITKAGQEEPFFDRFRFISFTRANARGQAWPRVGSTVKIRGYFHPILLKYEVVKEGSNHDFTADFS